MTCEVKFLIGVQVETAHPSGQAAPAERDQRRRRRHHRRLILLPASRHCLRDQRLSMHRFLRHKQRVNRVTV